jgi:hypothetical protein
MKRYHCNIEWGLSESPRDIMKPRKGIEIATGNAPPKFARIRSAAVLKASFAGIVRGLKSFS